MLFASTRLTLTRELGIERFRETIFVTTKEELTKEGFERHDKHTKLEAPLTEEEQSLGDVKRLEAEEGRGMNERKSHVSSGVSMPVSDEALQALKSLASKSSDNLVQLVCSKCPALCRTITDCARKSTSPRKQWFLPPLPLHLSLLSPLQFLQTSHDTLSTVIHIHTAARKRLQYCSSILVLLALKSRSACFMQARPDPQCRSQRQKQA